MRRAAGWGMAAFLAGAALGQALTPSGWLFGALSALALPLAACRPLRGPAWILLALAAGLAWTALRLVPPPDWHARLGPGDQVVEGWVAALPEPRPHGLRFVFQVRRWLAPQVPAHPRRLLLDWYGRPPDLRVGEGYRLTLRLRPAGGRGNPGGPDGATRLRLAGVEARAYVVGRAGFSALGGGSGGLDGLRQDLAEAIARHLQGRPSLGVVQALALGLRSGMAPDEWRVLLATGTNHLVAISGLHVGLVAAFAWFLGRRLWPWSGLAGYLPAPRFAALAALVAATAYAALAGFSVPTQRALIMLVVALGAPLLGRHPPPGRILLLAALAVVLWDPAALAAPGAWLSFAAVAVLLYVHHGRVWVVGGWGRLWRRWGRAQVLLALGLAPLTAGLFGQTALAAPVANLLAVPWTGFVVVPLVLLAVAALLLGLDGAGGAFLTLAAGAWDGLWAILEAIARIPPLALPQAPAWVWPAALAGTLWLLAPAGVPARWLGLVWLAPLLLLPPPRPPPEAFWFTLWDAGDGLAAVVETHDHLLVYDAGPPGTGQALARWLRARGWTRIDHLVLSHDDRAHTGGARALLAALPAVRVSVGEARAWTAPGARICEDGTRWRWDGVRFAFARPGVGGRGDDAGCLVVVENGAGRLWLTADLRRIHPRRLPPGPVDVLLVPDHGSRRGADLAALAPRHAVASVAAGNRWGHPRSEVVARYEAAGARWWDTARAGALAFRFPAHGTPLASPPCALAPGFCLAGGGWLE